MTAPERIWADFTLLHDQVTTFYCQDGPYSGGTEYIRADLAAVQPAQVRVKPLVWEAFGKECVRAESPFGLYDVMWGFGVELAYLTHCWKMWRHPTIEAAKAAAQADYEARILAALEPQPDPRDEVIARLVEENNWQIKARAQHWLRRTISAPEDAAVEEICEKYGYGAVMDAASRLWARKPYGSGAFYVGGCIGFKSDDEARAALAAAKAVQR